MKLSILLFDIDNIFIPHNIEKIAQNTGFIKRHSKINRLSNKRTSWIQ